MREVLIPPTLAYFAGAPTVNFLLPDAGGAPRSGSALDIRRQIISPRRRTTGGRGFAVRLE